MLPSSCLLSEPEIHGTRLGQDAFRLPTRFCRHTRVYYTFHIQSLSSPNMARATRSSATQDKDKPNDPPSPSNRKNVKKRKRTSIADSSELPALKQPRTEDDIKEEDVQNHLDDSLSSDIVQINLPSSGDVPIQPQHAEKILQVLSVYVPTPQHSLITSLISLRFPRIDTQTLLDRAVTLPSHVAESGTLATPSSTPESHTLRNLLQNASNYPMRTIRVCTLIFLHLSLSLHIII